MNKMLFFPGSIYKASYLPHKLTTEPKYGIAFILEHYASTVKSTLAPIECNYVFIARIFRELIIYRYFNREDGDLYVFFCLNNLYQKIIALVLKYLFGIEYYFLSYTLCRPLNGRLDILKNSLHKFILAKARMNIFITRTQADQAESLGLNSVYIPWQIDLGWWSLNQTKDSNDVLASAKLNVQEAGYDVPLVPKASLSKLSLSYRHKSFSYPLHGLPTYFSGPKIICVGDIERDESTLVKAAQKLGSTIYRVSRNEDTISAFLKICDSFGYSDYQEFYQIDFEELRELYLQVRIAVINSNSDYHPAGVTALTEACTMGCFVICKSGLTSSNYVDNGVNGLVLNDWSPLTLSEAILHATEISQRCTRASIRQSLIDLISIPDTRILH